MSAYNCSCIHGPVTIFPMIRNAHNCNKILIFPKSLTSDVCKLQLCQNILKAFHLNS